MCLIGICKDIVSDIINAVCYLHQNDIACRDINPSNALVNNHYCSSLKPSQFNWVFQKQPIVCKSRDLDKARSAFARRKEGSNYIYF